MSGHWLRRHWLRRHWLRSLPRAPMTPEHVEEYTFGVLQDWLDGDVGERRLRELAGSLAESWLKDRRRALARAWWVRYRA